MKTFPRIYLVLCIPIWFSTGCMTSTYLQVLQPAAFSLPDHIETIGTVNRSVPSSKVGNVLEGIISGEGIGQDKSGRRRAIEGLSDGLTRTPRFQVTFTAIEMKGGGGRFLAPLDWQQVDDICAEYKVDALAVLEKFDSDTHTETRRQTSKRKDKEGNEIIDVYFRSELETRVDLGWRLYDPSDRRIIDQFDVWEADRWGGRGNTEGDAIRRLPNQYQTVNDVSYAAGQKYAMRIAPTWVDVTRQFYPKDKNEAEMEVAKRLALRGEWLNAAVKWKAIYDRANDPKLKGKLAYNLAIASEVKGQLQTAVEWADTSYTQYNNKKAKNYLSILAERMANERALDEQL